MFIGTFNSLGKKIDLLNETCVQLEILMSHIYGKPACTWISTNVVLVCFDKSSKLNLGNLFSTTDDIDLI